MTDDNEIIVFIFSGEYRCDECGGEFLPVEGRDETPVLVTSDCPVRGAEQFCFHRRCVPEEIRAQVEENQRRMNAQWN